MPPKTHSLIVPYAGPPFPLTLLTEQAFTRFTAFELRMDDVTVIRRVIFFENVLRSWVEGISRRGDAGANCGVPVVAGSAKNASMLSSLSSVPVTIAGTG